MRITKQVADGLTLLRGFIALALVWLGAVQGAAALPLAVWLLLLSWTSDALDGTLARKSGRGPTWVGEHDLQFDISAALGLLFFMAGADFIGVPAVVVYILIWAVVFWHWSVLRPLGMLIQAPIYSWFIWVAVRDAPHAGQWLLAWIITIVILTWPRFPRQVIPEFLTGIQSVWHRQNNDQ